MNVKSMMIKSLIIAINQVVLGRIQCISVGPEQDWTGKSGSRMGSSKSEMVEDASKTVARKGHCLFDEGTKTLFAPQNIKTVPSYQSIRESMLQCV